MPAPQGILATESCQCAVPAYAAVVGSVTMVTALAGSGWPSVPARLSAADRWAIFW